MTDLDARLAVAVIGTHVVIDFGTHEAAMAGIERVRVLDAAAVRPAGLREAAQWLVDIHGRSVEHGSALWEDIERLRAAAADDAVQKRPSRAASGSLTTEAGRALSELIEAEAVYDPDPLVVAIEQEAAAAERARIERLVEGLPTMREKDMRGEGEDAVWVRFDVVEKSLVIAALRGEP